MEVCVPCALKDPNELLAQFADHNTITKDGKRLKGNDIRREK